VKVRTSLPLSVALAGSICFFGGLSNRQFVRADDRPPGRKQFIIVAPEKFRPALSEYVAYKQKRHPTELASLEDVLKTSAGVDAPERG
jgi:hypothetical protein